MNNFAILGACMYQFASRSLQWLFRSVMLLDVLAIENHHCVEASAKCDPSLEFLTGNLTWFNWTSLYFDLPWNVDNFNHWKGPMSPMILDKLWPHPAQEVMGETFQMDQDITFRIQNQLDLAWWIVIVQSYYPGLFCRAHNLHVVSSAARNTCTLTSLSSKQHAPSWSKQFWAKHDGRTCGLPMKSSAAWRSMKTLVPVTPFDTIIRSVFKLGHHHSPSFHLLWCGNSQFHRSWNTLPSIGATNCCDAASKVGRVMGGGSTCAIKIANQI